MTTTHPNSKKVTVFRSNNFIQNAQKDEAAKDFMDQSSQSIGPYYESSAARIIGSGLSIPEQKLIMPWLLQVEPEDKDFKRTLFDYFNGLTTKIPPTTGKDFEIGLHEDNSKPITKTNLPINIEQYVRYRHIKNHPWVADSLNAAKGNNKKLFYIHDADLQLIADTDKVVIQDEADEVWLKIRNQPQKITMLLTSLGFDERDFIGRNGPVRAKNELRAFIDTKAPKFLEVYRDDRFETKYWLRAMVKANVVQQVNQSFVIQENKKLLGKSELEAVLYLENTDNADTITYLKGITQDVLRKPNTTRKKVN